MAMLSDPVRQWGLLKWNKRWVTFEGSAVSLYKSETGPDGEPIVSFDLALPSCKFELDASHTERLILDNSIAIIHLKFGSAAARQVRWEPSVPHSGALCVCQLMAAVGPVWCRNTQTRSGRLALLSWVSTSRASALMPPSTLTLSSFYL